MSLSDRRRCFQRDALKYFCLVAAVFVLSGCVHAQYTICVLEESEPPPESYEWYKVVSALPEDERGLVRGRVLAGASGEALPATNVEILGTRIRMSVEDLDGSFELSIPDSVSTDASVRMTFITFHDLEVPLAEIQNKEVVFFLPEDHGGFNEYAIDERLNPIRQPGAYFGYMWMRRGGHVRYAWLRTRRWISSFSS